jgi:translation initiation factor 1
VRRQKGENEGPSKKPSDGIFRIQRETKGRKGKTVTVIYGFNLDDAEIKKIASGLKNRCGSVKDSVIIIQGNHRNTAKDELAKMGYKVKLAGG